jgi:cellulose synthase (UDP-forming)
MTIKLAVKKWINDILGRGVYRRYQEREKRKQRVIGQLFSLSVLISAVFYIVWCMFQANMQYWYMTVPFILTEFVFLFLFLLWTNVLWNKRFHRPEGPPVETKNYSVDIFIPVCKEPLDIVENTMIGATSIDYKNKTVYLLDDGGDDALIGLSEKYGITYIRRPTHEHSKAGNFNYALQQSHGDLILAIDADQVAKPEFIKSIIGYFSIPKIGFVQTEQNFILPKDDPWGNADKVFYRVMQPGKDYDNAAISCGNGCMYRRSAIESIGGFSTWNLVEDLHTSLKLHGKKWISVYHGIAYTKGTAPQDVLTQSKQRWQWSVDSLRMIFWDSPLKYKNLSWAQRLQYFHFGFNYIAFGLCLPIFFIIPIWALFTHHFMLSTPLWKYVLARLPYFILYAISNKIITDKIHSFKVFQAQAGLFHVYLHALITALLSKNRVPKYTVTRKVAIMPNFFSRLFKCLPHIAFVVFAILSVIFGILTIHDDIWFLLVNAFWALWVVALLWRFIALSLFPKLFTK